MNNESNTYEIDDVNAVKNTQDSLNLLKIQNKKINELYTILDERDSDLKKIQINFQNLEKKYQQSQSLLNQTDKKLKETLTQLNTQNSEQQKLMNDFANLQNLCHENSATLSQYENDIASLSKEVENINSVNKILKDKNNCLLKEKITLTEKIEFFADNEQKLKNKVKDLFNTVSDRENKLGQIKNLNAKLLVEKTNYENEISALTQKNNKISAKLLDKETEKDKIINDFKKLNLKYNDTINKVNSLNEQNYKLKIDNDSMRKLQNDLEKKIKGYQNQISQLTISLDNAEKRQFDINSELSNFISKISNEISKLLCLSEDYLAKRKVISPISFLNSKKIKEIHGSLINTIPSVCPLLDIYDHLINCLASITKQNASSYNSIKNLTNKVSFLEQISLDSKQTIITLQEQNSQQNQQNLKLSEKHNDDLAILSQNIDQLNSEIKSVNKVIIQSYNEMYKKYKELSGVLYNSSLKLKEQKLKTEDSFSNINDVIFGIETINKDLINYIMLLLEENKNVIKLKEENNNTNKQKRDLEQEISQLKFSIERNNNAFLKAKENIINEYEKQMMIDLNNAKDIALSEVKILNKKLIEKDEELVKVKNDYKLLYTQYRLLQKENDDINISKKTSISSYSII